MASVRQIFSLFLKYDYSAILWHWNAPRWRQRHGGRRGSLSEAQLWQNFQVSGDSQTTLQRISHSGRWPVLPLSHLWDGLQAQEETGRASEPCPRDQGLSGQCPHAQLISVEPVLVKFDSNVTAFRRCWQCSRLSVPAEIDVQIAESNGSHICLACGRKFNFKTSAVRHYRTQHVPTSRSQCHVCKRFFKNRIVRNTHRAHAHGITETMMKDSGRGQGYDEI